MMQCGSSLRGQDSALTDDGGVFNNIFIIHIMRPLRRTLAIVRCVILLLPRSQFHNYQKIISIFWETADISICNETIFGSVLLQIKRLLILCFVHIVLSKSIIGYLLHGDVDNYIFYIIYDHGSILAVPG